MSRYQLTFIFFNTLLFSTYKLVRTETSPPNSSEDDFSAKIPGAEGSLNSPNHEEAANTPDRHRDTDLTPFGEVLDEELYDLLTDSLESEAPEDSLPSEVRDIIALYEDVDDYTGPIRVLVNGEMVTLPPVAVDTATRYSAVGTSSIIHTKLRTTSTNIFTTDVRHATVFRGPRGLGCYFKSDKSPIFSDTFYSSATASYKNLNMRNFELDGDFKAAKSLHCFFVENKQFALGRAILALEAIDPDSGLTKHYHIYVDMMFADGLVNFNNKAFAAKGIATLEQEMTVIRAAMVHAGYQTTRCSARVNGVRVKNEISKDQETLVMFEGINSFECYINRIWWEVATQSIKKEDGLLRKSGKYLFSKVKKYIP